MNQMYSSNIQPSSWSLVYYHHSVNAERCTTEIWIKPFSFLCKYQAASSTCETFRYKRLFNFPRIPWNSHWAGGRKETKPQPLPSPSGDLTTSWSVNTEACNRFVLSDVLFIHNTKLLTWLLWMNCCMRLPSNERKEDCGATGVFHEWMVI